MGGNAFHASMPDASFPRMAPQTYNVLKAQHLAQLQALFRLVEVPREAPGKESHGDIDYAVCSPLRGARAEDLKKALGAEHCIAESHTTNLAIQMERVPAFYQVDVHECQDEAEWRRVVFFQSYGDLGMILGVVARNNGLSLGLHGLKVPAGDSMAPFLLSDDFGRILAFFGLDITEWEMGFTSERSVFEWVATSRLFYARTFREAARRERRRADRKMYQAFLRWVLEQREGEETVGGTRIAEDIAGDVSTVVEEAKEFFGMKEAYDGEVERAQRRRLVKEALSGPLVMEWTGLKGPAVGKLIRAVRESMDEDTILGLAREDMRVRVLDALARP